MSLLLFPHIFNDFWNEFDHRLRVPYFEDVVYLQVGSVALEPLFPTDVVLFHNLSKLLFVERSFDETNNFTLAPVELSRFRNLFDLLVNSFFIYDHLTGFVDSFRTEDCNLWRSLLVGGVGWHHDYVRLLARESFGTDPTQSVLRLLLAGSL